MLDMARRLAWFFVVSTAVAYAVFLVVGSAIQAQSAELLRSITVRDEIRANQHNLSGMVMVDSNCVEVSVRTEQLSDIEFELALQTWDAPSVTCNKEVVPRAFRAVVFAPATGVYFVASLDGLPLPITIVPIAIKK